MIYKIPIYQSFVRLRTTLQTILYSNDGEGCQKEIFALDNELKKGSLTMLCDLLEMAIKSTDDLSFNTEEYICDGYDTQVDTLRQLVHHTDQILLSYHQQLISHTNITEVKIVFVTNQ